MRLTNQVSYLERDKRRLQERLSARENYDLRSRPAAGDGSGAGDVDPARIVWIFGSPRTGSTWLGDMLGEREEGRVWNEPLVGNLFGHFYDKRVDKSGKDMGARGRDYILGQPYRETWINSIRRFVLDAATVRFPEVAGGEGYIVVKEPTGSVGAPLLAEALPESRLIFLIRDYRDTVASKLSASEKGGWAYELRLQAGRDAERPTKNPNHFVRQRAKTYMLQASNAKKAYDAHIGPKVLVKYEDLRTDTMGTMKRIYSELDIPVDEGELARVVDKHSWENIPEDQKGRGKPRNKAEIGAWKEELTPQQARIVEEETGPLLREFYPVD